MSQVAAISRTASDISRTVHENYVNEILPWIDHIDAFSALFQKIGPKGYTLVGETLNLAADDSYAGGFQGTDGYLPDHQEVQGRELSTTASRLYIRRAVDNFLRALAVKPGAYEDFYARLNKQMVDAVERGTARHIHGGTASTVCTFVSRTDADTLVVDAGLGHAGQNPTAFIEPGMYLALLDASISYNTIGAAEVSSISYTSATTATINFAATIDGSSTATDGDPLVFCTSADTSATNFVTERNRAPMGMLDIVSPAASITSLMGLAEATSARWTPTRRASVDFGQVEIMEFLEEIGSRSNSEVSAQTHVVTMQNGVWIELAKDILPYQQQAQLGRELQGGWTTVRVGEHDFLKSPFHLWDAVYALPPEDLAVVSLDGEASLIQDDGLQMLRLADYDGTEWAMRHYVQRFPTRRNRIGALTGVSNPNHQRYSTMPVAV